MNEWNNFLSAVKNAEAELGNPKEVWYRGQGDKDWLLIPSLFRVADWERKEKELFIEFKKTTARLFEKRSNDWEILFDMQHYWIPTRLLDWTTVLGVAIAFILHNDKSNSNDSSLFLLNPEALNQLSGRNEVINIPEDKGFDYQKVYWDNNPVRIDKPIAIRPAMITDRLQAQKGTFSVHGTLESGFETAASSCIRKVILPRAAKEEGRNFLKWANLDEYTIYPDIVGMAQYIQRKILS